MSEKTVKKTVMALGYFDSVHKGHTAVILRAKEIAKSCNANLTVFTFKGNLKQVLTGEKSYTVFTPFEREELIKEVGADEVYFAPTDFDFLSLTPTEFLSRLRKKYDIVAFVSGADYKFGKFGKGDVNKLKEYSEKYGIYCETVDTVETEGKKISTTLIKELLISGEMEKANSLLGRSYFYTGKVISDRGVGNTIGYPTANISVDEFKQPVKNGVYIGKVVAEGKKYKAIINVGARPTFNENKSAVEAHLIDFSGDLYGKTITVYFEKFIREIKKFYNAEELKEQLKKDEEKAREML